MEILKKAAPLLDACQGNTGGVTIINNSTPPRPKKTTPLDYSICYRTALLSDCTLNFHSYAIDCEFYIAIAPNYTNAI